jgi:hypothetical protein
MTAVWPVCANALPFSRGCARVVVLPKPRSAVRETVVSRHRRQVKKMRFDRFKRIFYAFPVQGLSYVLRSGGAVTQLVELSYAEFVKMSTTLKEVASKLDRL